MKKNIHPKYKQVSIKCLACDQKFSIMSNEEGMTVTLCSNCHPLYSGGLVEKKAVGRVERFNKKINKNK